MSSTTSSFLLLRHYGSFALTVSHYSSFEPDSPGADIECTSRSRIRMSRTCNCVALRQQTIRVEFLASARHDPRPRSERFIGFGRPTTNPMILGGNNLRSMVFDWCGRLSQYRLPCSNLMSRDVQPRHGSFPPLNKAGEKQGFVRFVQSSGYCSDGLHRCTLYG